MTRRRWIADEVQGARAALVGAHAAHLARVLRARVGQEFEVAAAGRVRRARVTSVSEERVEFELGGDVLQTAGPEVTVLLAIFKFDRFEWALEKLTELGATAVVPVISARTEARLARAARARVQRWQRVARQAAEQSRRAEPPRVADPIRLREALASATGTRIVLAESEEQVGLKQALAARESGGPLTLAVGPEGGWTEEEVAAFTGAGWTAASLGRSILRAETAAIAAVAVVMAELS